ncbi:MAG: hypothetical protein JZU65_02035 [Chlorobium sp.]|jgi:hypothetical protein|nr:hypothetical protein [Chlorobium sp.]
MEATIFTGWIHDFLTPFAVELKVAHPEMLKAITVAKKKNDRRSVGGKSSATIKSNRINETEQEADLPFFIQIIGQIPCY